LLEFALAKPERSGLCVGAMKTTTKNTVTALEAAASALAAAGDSAGAARLRAIDQAEASAWAFNAGCDARNFGKRSVADLYPRNWRDAS
jgi:hypothetical protein